MLGVRPEEEGRLVLARLQIISGLLAGVLGVLGFVYTLIDVPVRYDLGTIVVLVILVIGVVGSVVGTLLHHQLGLQSGLALLWICSLVLLVATVTAAFTFGGYLTPAAGAALLAAAAGSGTGPQHTHTPNHDHTTTA